MLVFLLQDRYVQFVRKIMWRKTCARVEFGPPKINGHSIVAVLLSPMHKICMKLYRSSFLYVQDVCHIIQLNLNISNTHARWKSVRIIQGNRSISQAGGKLQSVQVSEGFELNSVVEISRFTYTSVAQRLCPRVAQDVRKITLHSSMCKICARLYFFLYLTYFPQPPMF